VTLTALNRWKASAIHLALSAAIGISVIALMLALWYPQHYFAAMGGDTLIMLLIGVDVVIGPLITLIIFDPKKKNLRFDLAVIALLQLTALVYGCSVMFKARPVFNVFVVDRFEVIAANAVDEESLEKAKPPFRTLPLTGPKIAGAREPEDPKRHVRHRDLRGQWRQRPLQFAGSLRPVRRSEGARRREGQAACAARQNPASGCAGHQVVRHQRPAGPRTRSASCR
jgi:hypothetical protein